MSNPASQNRLWQPGATAVGLVLLASTVVSAQEPPAINPFGPIRTEREDALPGYIEFSDGKVLVGNIYMTRDKRLKIYDGEAKRQREIPLRVAKRIECQVLKEWMEKEWRFKELALDEKYYTGRKYPARECEYTITLRDGRKITGPIAELFYLQPLADSGGATRPPRPVAKPEKYLVHKRQKGEPGTTLDSLVYVKVIKLGEDAIEEGKQKARSRSPEGSSRTEGAE